jgi:uncharacterized membrane protein YczE
MQISKNLIRRIVMMCIGVFLLGFSISLAVYANFGTDPCTCLNLGVSGKIGLQFGTWQLIFNCIVLIFMFLLSRDLIGIGTLVNMVSIGFLVDFFRWLYSELLPSQPTFPVRILLMIFALLLLSFSAALYIYPNLGVSPYDSLGFMVSKHLHIQFRWCRILCDVLAVLVGWLCGSVVGVSTVITAFCMGPLIKKFNDLIAKRFPLEFD